MILTGDQISRSVADGDITISDFRADCVEPNAYGFHLGRRLITYLLPSVDSFEFKPAESFEMPESGFELAPDRFYLGHTAECMGSRLYAAELYARLSTAACGIFIQTSAPLGHTGAVIRWTLEIVVAQRVVVYPGMLIGKICFWRNQGDITPYAGRYQGSTTTIPSRLSWSAT